MLLLVFLYCNYVCHSVVYFLYYGANLLNFSKFILHNINPETFKPLNKNAPFPMRFLCFADLYMKILQMLLSFRKNLFYCFIIHSVVPQ